MAGSLNVENSRGDTRTSEWGQLLLLVLLVLCVVAIFGGAAITLATSHRQTAARQRNRMQAYYAADAGVERALVMIKQTSGLLEQILLNSPVTLMQDVPYAGGKIEKVTAEKLQEGPGTLIKVVSEGTFIGARRKLAVKLRISGSGELFKGVSLFPGPPSYQQKMNGNFTLVGKGPGVALMVNGSLDVRGSVSIVNASVYASGTIQGITGSNVHPNYPAVPGFPELDREWYESHADYFFSGDTDFPDDLLGSGSGGKKDHGDHVAQYDGLYFVDGDLEISGTYAGKAVIVATGNIDVVGDLQPDGGDQEGNLLVLVSLRPGGHVDIKNHTVEALVICNGTFYAQGRAHLTGGLIARQLDSDGSVRITCDPDVIEANGYLVGLAFSGGEAQRMTIQSWSEE
ncbi:MAG: hypothetical protein ACPLPR_10375 [Bacillota bacterium]